jgi:hypothetical protein
MDRGAEPAQQGEDLQPRMILAELMQDNGDLPSGGITNLDPAGRLRRTHAAIDTAARGVLDLVR